MNSDDLNPLYKTRTIGENPPKFLSGMSTIYGNRFFDNSMLDTYRVCPRRFYFNHIRHWESSGTKAALIFGSSWHQAMDFLWQHPTEDINTIFNEGFMSFWNKSDLAQTEHFDLFPRTPPRAKEMLTKYIDRYSSWLQNIELLAVEFPFVVPLSVEVQNLFYIGKWDKVFKEYNDITILDHKTSSSFANTWLNSWSPNGQVDGYLYASHMKYGNSAKRVLIDGALVQKTNVDFMRVPIERQMDMLEQWKWEVLDLLETIMYQEALLQDYRDQPRTIGRETFLPAFPKCTTSCTSYYGSCPFLSICKYVTNPEDSDLPDGYQTKTWQPFDIAETPDGEFIITELEHT